MSPDGFVSIAGIVDKVRAIRNTSTDEVMYLEATVHAAHADDYKSQYGSQYTSDWIVPLPITTAINPGDLVSITVQFATPHAQRFVPALEVGEPDDDVLDVNVEEGMINDG